jgi:hypothetical protein
LFSSSSSSGTWLRLTKSLSSIVRLGSYTVSLEGTSGRPTATTALTVVVGLL